MWTLTVDAGSLLSVVQFDPKKAPAMAKRHGAADPEQRYLLVRSRIKASLGYVAEVLEAIYKGESDGWQRPIIDEDKTADYKYRTIVTPDEWKKFLCYEVDGIDYDSHVKEETVKRQPEPKVKNLYSALSATWSAWAKLQDTPPYGGYAGSWKAQPDCKNCDHTELSHTLKGDKCNKMIKDGKCTCTKYEPKPVAAKPAVPAVVAPAQQSIVYPSAVYGSMWDDDEPATPPADDSLITEAWDVDENGVAHLGWCSVWDGDSCICAEPSDEEMWDGSFSITSITLPAVKEPDDTVVPGGIWINGTLVPQEDPPANESRKARKARLERNRRRRRAARKTAVA